MISIKKYPNLVFEDLSPLFRKTNIQYYEYASSLGLSINLDGKDQQKIYYHFFATNLCELIKSFSFKYRVVFYYNQWDCTELQKKIIKKTRSLFGFRVWLYPLPLTEFLEKLADNDIPVIDQFEVYVMSDTNPKSLKLIKKKLRDEGFVRLVEDYFESIENKIAVLY
jgi:hypothetical protein